MTINASSRRSRLIVGSLDCTQMLVSYDGADAKYSQAGLITHDATFILKPTLGSNIDCDDRFNPLWGEGQLIRLEISNAADILVPHPRGALRVKESQWDGVQLTIQAGCLLNVLSFKEPQGDKSGVNLGDTTSPTVVVNRLCAAAGLPSFIGTIDDTFPFTAPLPKMDSGSYVEQIGKILWSRGYIGWIDNQERFRIRKIYPLLDAQIMFEQTVGVNEIEYSRITGAEKPVEKITVSGLAVKRSPNNSVTESLEEEYGPTALVLPESGDVGVALISQISKREVVNFLGRNIRTTTTTLQPAGLIYPERFRTTSLVQGEYIEETRTYEISGSSDPTQPDEGRLLKITTSIYRPMCVVLRDWLANLQKKQVDALSSQLLIPTLASESITTYQYSNNVPRISTLITETVGALLPREKYIEIPISMYLSEQSEQLWVEIRPGEWEERTKLRQALAKAFPQVIEAMEDSGTIMQLEGKLTLVNKRTTSEKSNAGQSQPPAPERAPAPYSQLEEPINAEIRLPSVIPNPLNKPRERNYSVDNGLLSSVEQGEQLAELEGAILYGRYSGRQCSADLSDEWLDYEPLVRVNYTEADGKRQAYLVDGAAFVLSNRRCLVGFQGIWLGEVQ